jgi:hypothetical protein
VQDSDGTLVVNKGDLDGGSLKTVRIAEQLGKPRLVIQLDVGGIDEQSRWLRDWLGSLAIRTLNVAGPRESKCPGIYAATLALLDAALDYSNRACRSGSRIG